MTNSPVITGLGLVGAPGCGVEANWNFIRAGQSGLKPLTLFPSPRYGEFPAGEAPRDLTALGAPQNASRGDQLGWLAAREAIASAKINLESCAARAGIVLGCSVGGSFDSERFLTTLIKQGKVRARPARYHECVSVVDLIARDFGLFGPGMAISTACSSGALAIATAAEFIQSGEAEVMLAGGADSLSRMTWGGFSSLLLVDPVGCRPFDARRAGTSLGEGAGVLILESEQYARARGAKILARLSGWGASCDAHHTTAPHPEGAGAAAAMQAALHRAQLEPGAIDYVNAHGTATRDNDLAESKALKSVFRESLPPVSSTKRFFGHALAASGPMEAVVCVQALLHQVIPANPGFSELDPAIGFAPVTTMRDAQLRHVMSNSFGFGGNNATLIFSRADVPAPTRNAPAVPLVVTGLGVIGPGILGDRGIEAPMPPGKTPARNCGALADDALLTPNQRRRLGRITRMALIAARRGHPPAQAQAQRLGVVIATGLGCLEEGGVFIENLIAHDERSPMPSRFTGSVHNDPAAQVAIDQGARAINSVPTAGEISFECALWQAARQLATGEADAVLAGAVDELNKYPLGLGQRWGFWTAQNVPGEGAMVAGLARADQANGGLARVTAVRLGRQSEPFDAEAEADWIAAAVDLARIEIVLTGAGGWPDLDARYAEVVAALSRRAGRPLKQQNYKNRCGEFHSASAFGFSVAVELIRSGCRGVLMHTLAMRGAKALCLLEP